MSTLNSSCFSAVNPAEANACKPILASPRLTPPLKWHGGKHYLAERIIDLMPSHVHYIEPYYGGGAVLLAKNPTGVSEVVNDCHGELTNFWRVLQNDEQFLQFQRIIEAMPFSQHEWTDACNSTGKSAVERAVAFFVICRQSRAGQMQNFAPLSKTRTRRAMNEQASAWMTAVEGLPQVAVRLKQVVIYNDDALAVIRREDNSKTLFYCDPPYLHATRTATDVYDFEMTESDHQQLLNLLNEVEGAVLLSGYRSDLYDSMLTAPMWERIEFELPNNAASGSVKRRMVECVWRKAAVSR